LTPKTFGVDLKIPRRELSLKTVCRDSRRGIIFLCIEVNGGDARPTSNIEAEEHDIPVADDVIAAFDTVMSGFASTGY